MGSLPSTTRVFFLVSAKTQRSWQWQEETFQRVGLNGIERQAITYKASGIGIDVSFTGGFKTFTSHHLGDTECDVFTSFSSCLCNSQKLAATWSHVRHFSRENVGALARQILLKSL